MGGCAACGHENPAGARFCNGCGGALVGRCAACGTANAPGSRFCSECGARLEAAPDAAPAAAAPVAERRLVTVLFADLVGFTTLSESRDPEDVRELLSRYFESCRRLIELYGGVVEKFIGDAVMAVWGTPVAQEDDAERAVRAALDLVAAVDALGDDVRAPHLRARAGVLTGEAAVNLGAVGEGMVAGDLVNTAARIQSAAEPGTVLVGDAARHASEQSIAYEDAGELTLKGKTERVPVWRAVRVTAARGGAHRAEGLEAPFVGRQRELRLVKELFHTSAEQSRAQLVQIAGVGGIGKSRLAWEFFKYLDGLAEQVLWHQGRCLSYGEGVAYWALAEIVRMRARILEGEEQETARAKLDACLVEHVHDPEERAWIAPRLRNLLGLEDRADTDRQDLFAAWRLFFERLCDAHPVVLVFEDLQWADDALLAFIEHLLEWSNAQRLFVLTLARPELADDRPEFGRSVRTATTLALEPLSDGDVTSLLDGYVPGLPDDLKSRVREHAEGVPLYAVETVRMLLNRGLLVRDGAAYRPTAAIDALEVPETLHALVAARLDGLPAEERQLVQQACVLGQSFTVAALAALTGREEAQLEPLLGALVRKEVLAFQADRRGLDEGEYAFVQELLRRVAYGTLSRRDRKLRHLAAVGALEQTFPEAAGDIPEIVASHLLAAADAVPNADDAREIRLRARAALVQAGERAAALAAPDEGRRYLDRAAALAADDPPAQAELLERAGRLAYAAGSTQMARERLEHAIELHRARDDAQAAARSAAALADVDVAEGRLEEAAARFRAAVSTLELGGPTPELAVSLAQLGRMHLLRGEREPAAATLERALQLAEVLALDETLTQGLTSRALLLMLEGRPVEARVLLDASLARASASGLHAAWWRAANNLSLLLEYADDYAGSLALKEQIEAQARQRGDRELLSATRLGAIGILAELGRFGEALERVDEANRLEGSAWARAGVLGAAAVQCERGDAAAARLILDDQEWQRGAEIPEAAASFAAVEARVLRAEGRPEDALAAAERGLAYRVDLGIRSPNIRACLAEALEAAFELDDLVCVGDLLTSVDDVRAGELTPLLEAQRARYRARLGAARGDDDGVDERYRRAGELLGAHGFAFHLAATQVEHAEWLRARGRSDEAGALAAAARETFVRLGAAPWLARLDAAPAGVPG